MCFTLGDGLVMLVVVVVEWMLRKGKPTLRKRGRGEERCGRAWRWFLVDQVGGWVLSFSVDIFINGRVL